MIAVLGLLATIAAGLFAGAAVYITAVEHPARQSCGTAVAVTEFRPSYRRATLMQAPLALLGAITAIARSVATGSFGWFAGGVLLGAIVPFTLLVIAPTNHRLLDPSLDPAAPEAAALLARWARLHALRTIASLIAFVVFIVLLQTG